MEIKVDNNKKFENNVPIEEEIDEKQSLIKKKKKIEKNRLLEIFDRLITELKEDNNDTISEAYYLKEEEYNRTIKKDINKCSFFFIFMFSIVFLLFAIFYLIGFFILAPISNLILNLLFSSLKCRLDISCDKQEFNKQKNFFNYLLSESRKVTIDVDLITFWSFIGLNILETCRFRKTCSLFLILNIIMLCFIYIFDFRISDENYGIVRIILLGLLYLLICLILGSSSLISQKTVIDIYSNLGLTLENFSNYLFRDKNKNDNNIESSGSGIFIKSIENSQTLKNKVKESNTNIIKNDELQNKKDISTNKNSSLEKNDNTEKKIQNVNISFWFVYLTTMAAYISKFYIYKLLIYLFKDSEDNITYNIDSDTMFNTNSTITDVIINNNISNSDIINDNNTVNDTLFNISINSNDYLEMKIEEKYIYLIICGIYILCIILSIILYTIFEYCIFEKRNNNAKSKNNNNCCVSKIFFKIFNCDFYIENIKVKNSKKAKNCKLCGETIKNYCSNVCANSIKSFCTLIKKDFKCNCCNCCKYNEEDYDKDTQCFCYCYQEKGCCEWLDKFITNDVQMQIIPSMIIYFFSRLSAIGCELYYENEKENFNIDQSKFVAIFILMFLVYLLIILMNIFLLQWSNDDKKSLAFQLLNSFYSEQFYILFFISCYGLIASITYLIKKDDDYLFNIILNKMFFFSFNYYCTNVSENTEKNEILSSQSALISIYKIIINLIIYLIKYFTSKNLKTLYIIQFVFSSIGVLFTSIIFLWILFSIVLCVLMRNECCVCYEGKFLCKCCCCDKNSLRCKYCYSHLCEKSCSYCQFPKICNKCFGKAIIENEDD